MKYQIQQRETGIIIADCTTLSKAESILKLYEANDKVNGDYEPNFYEIVKVGFIQDYFESIMTRIESGHKYYALSLYNKLKKSQKKHFHNWLETTYFYESHDNEQHGSVTEITEMLG